MKAPHTQSPMLSYHQALLRLQDRDPPKDLYLLNRRQFAPGVSKLIEVSIFDTLILRRVLTQTHMRKGQCLVGEREVCQKRTFLTQPLGESPLCEFGSVLFLLLPHCCQRTLGRACPLFATLVNLI